MASEDGYPLLNLLEVMGQGDAFSALEAERDLLFLELESMSSQPSSPQPPLPQAALLDLEEDDRDEQPSIPLALPLAPPRPQPELVAAAISQNPQQSTQGGGGAITLLTAGAGGEHPSLMEASSLSSHACRKTDKPPLARSVYVTVFREKIVSTDRLVTLGTKDPPQRKYWSRQTVRNQPVFGGCVGQASLLESWPVESTSRTAVLQSYLRGHAEQPPSGAHSTASIAHMGSSYDVLV